MFFLVLNCIGEIVSNNVVGVEDDNDIGLVDGVVVRMGERGVLNVGIDRFFLKV